MATTSDASVITLGNLKKYNDNLKSTILDPMDAEVKANAADITGIEGLTYGTGGQKFVEKADGSYTSPALIEIQHEMETNATAIGTLNSKVDGLHPVTWNQLTGKPFSTVGTGLTVDDDAVAVNWDDNPDKHTPYILPVATGTVLGGIKKGTGLNIATDGTASVDFTGYVTTDTMNTALAQKQDTLTFATDDDINAIFS